MSIEKIDINNFLQLADQNIILDVRSPTEYKQAHFPGAYSLPLFNDEERKIVGITYKQQNRELAIKTGLDIFGIKMRSLVEEAEQIVSEKNETLNKKRLPFSNCILMYCWRGGMRSAAMAWLLDIYGFKIYTLKGGYKQFRNWTLDQFDKAYNLKILGGYTGSGKTEVLKELQRTGYHVIDLENLASHRGSAFGGLGEKPQPKQEMFENLLATELYKKSLPLEQANNVSEKNEIWVEDESQRIGLINIPKVLWDKMQSSPVYFLDIPFEERLNFIIKVYGSFEIEKLQESITRIQKRLGNLHAKNAINFLKENNIKDCFRILLEYYDKLYNKCLVRKNPELLLNKISSDNVSIANINNLPIFEKQD